MSRYTDVDALKEYIGSVRAEFNFFDDDERARYEAHSKAIYLLDLYVNDAPSIDLVRCAECRWARPRTLKGETGYRCLFYRVDKAEDGYCDNGEREDE